MRSHFQMISGMHSHTGAQEREKDVIPAKAEMQLSERPRLHGGGDAGNHLAPSKGCSGRAETSLQQLIQLIVYYKIARHVKPPFQDASDPASDRSSAGVTPRACLVRMGQPVRMAEVARGRRNMPMSWRMSLGAVARRERFTCRGGGEAGSVGISDTGLWEKGAPDGSLHKKSLQGDTQKFIDSLKRKGRAW